MWFEVRAGAEVARFPSARFYDNRIFMKKSINDNQKRRGRPATGTAPLCRRSHDRRNFRGRSRHGQSTQADKPTLAEAIRRLVELGLKATKPVKATRSMPNKLRAAELAAKAIDGIVDTSAPPEERAQRRRRLTKGPPEFREDRVDLPKAKGR